MWNCCGSAGCASWSRTPTLGPTRCRPPCQPSPSLRARPAPSARGVAGRKPLLTLQQLFRNWHADDAGYQICLKIERWEIREMRGIGPKSWHLKSYFNLDFYTWHQCFSLAFSASQNTFHSLLLPFEHFPRPSLKFNSASGKWKREPLSLGR